MELKGTKTEENLKKAYAGESEARNKYTYYGAKAKADGFIQIGNIFEETANEEREHAKMWFKILHGGIPSTEENLKESAGGEEYETSNMYPEFARVAREEGFTAIAKLFDGVGGIENEHELRFKKLLNNVENGLVFTKEGDVMWECTNCGYTCFGQSAPKICPVCAYPQGFFQVACENY
jgi:rubrerythrin